MAGEDKVESIGLPDGFHVIDPAAAGNTKNVSNTDIPQCLYQ